MEPSVTRPIAELLIRAALDLHRRYPGLDVRNLISLGLTHGCGVLDNERATAVVSSALDEMVDVMLEMRSVIPFDVERTVFTAAMKDGKLVVSWSEKKPVTSAT